MADAWGGSWGIAWGSSFGLGTTPIPPQPPTPVVITTTTDSDGLNDILCGWTKGDFVRMAFEEIGLGGYEFDMQPEQLNSALKRLDALCSTWNGKGIRLGYPMPCCPEGSQMQDATGVPDSANEALYTNLAIRLAPTLGKTVSAETRMVAKAGYDVLLARATMPNQMQFPASMPSGAGNRRRTVDRPFLRRPVDPLTAGDDAPIEFN